MTEVQVERGRLCLAWPALDPPLVWLAGSRCVDVAAQSIDFLIVERRNAGDWDTGSTKNSRSLVKFNQASRDR